MERYLRRKDKGAVGLMPRINARSYSIVQIYLATEKCFI